MPNTLYYGDNLEVLRKYIRTETVDLCYIRASPRARVRQTARQTSPTSLHSALGGHLGPSWYKEMPRPLGS